MTTYSYFLHGGPQGEPRTLPGQEGDVPHVLTIERRTEPGTVDLYVRTNHSETFRTARFEWHSGGTPEDVMQTFANLAREAQQR
jgi:hypothetical protein